MTTEKLANLGRMKRAMLRICDEYGSVTWRCFSKYNRYGVMSPSAREHARRAQAAINELVAEGGLVPAPHGYEEWRRT